ncbi:hypothetical protein J5834_03755, partial [bacterium]|nr:hypothetical protein [bacterium]
GGAGGRDNDSERQCKPGNGGTNGTKADNSDKKGGTLGSEGGYWGDLETIANGSTDAPWSSRGGYGFNDFSIITGLEGRKLDGGYNSSGVDGGWGGGGCGSDGYLIGGSYQGGGGGGYSGGAASNSNVLNSKNSGGGGGGSLVNEASGRYLGNKLTVTGGANYSAPGEVLITLKKYAPCSGCGFDAASPSSYITCTSN